MDLSFLPDQPKKKVDLAFLPDKPVDLSFLPDKPQVNLDIDTYLSNQNVKPYNLGPVPPGFERPGIQQIKTQTMPRTALPEKLAKGFGTGIAGMEAGVGGAAKWVGLKEIGDAINKDAQEMQEFYDIPDKDFTYNLASGVGSMATFFIPGIGVQSGALKLATLTPRIARILGASTMALFEAGIEAGSTYNRVIEKGGDTEENRKKASKAASMNFIANIPLNYFTNKLGYFGNKETRKLVKTAISADSEGLQEGMQQVFSNYAAKDPIMQGVFESAGMGAILGGGIGGIQALSEKSQPPKIRPPQEPAQGIQPQTALAVVPQQPQTHQQIAPVTPQMTVQPNIEQVPVQPPESVKTEIQPDFKQMVENQGLKYNGIQKDGEKNVILFTEPETGSTLAIPEEQMTPEYIKQRVDEKKKLFKGLEQPEAEEKPLPTDPAQIQAEIDQIEEDLFVKYDEDKPKELTERLASLERERDRLASEAYKDFTKGMPQEEGTLKQHLDDLGKVNFDSIENLGYTKTEIKMLKKAYGQGNRVPDEAASEMYDANLISGSNTEDMIEALKREAGITADTMGKNAKYRTQEEKNLVVLHNISSEKLRHADKIGGLAMPSLAVSRTEHPIEGFGEISLIGNPEMAIPSRETKVFNADKYSPRYPTVSYQVDWNKVKAYKDRMVKAVEKYKGTVPEHISDTGINSLQNNIEERGFDGAKRDKGLKLIYMAEHNIPYTDDSFYGIKNTPGFEKFAQEVVDNVVSKERIFRGFTYSGNRRYSSHDIDSVVKIMKSEMKEGESFIYGAPSVRAAIAKQYKTLEGIKADRNKIISKDEMEKIKKEFESQYNEIIDNAREHYTHKGTNDFSTADTFTRVVIDGIKNGKLSSDLKEYGFEGIDMDKLYAFLNAIKQAPTEYFEAKLQRAVKLNEFKAAVVPEGTPQSTIDLLRKNGIGNITFYDEKLPGDRQKVIERISTGMQLKFRKGETITLETLTPEQQTKIKSIVKKITGSDNVEFVNKILSNPEATGMYEDGKITIATEAGFKEALKTAPHEAVHQVIDMLAEPELVDELMTEAKKAAKTKDDYKAEEFIATKFEQYYETGKGVWGRIKQIFDLIIARFKKFLGMKQTLNDFFAEVRSGKYAKEPKAQPTRETAPAYREGSVFKGGDRKYIFQNVKKAIEQKGLSKTEAKNILQDKFKVDTITKLSTDELAKYQDEIRNIKTEEYGTNVHAANKLKAKIHMYKKDLKLSQREYDEIATQETGKASTKRMTFDELKKFEASLKSEKDLNEYMGEFKDLRYKVRSPEIRKEYDKYLKAGEYEKAVEILEKFDYFTPIGQTPEIGSMPEAMVEFWNRIGVSGETYLRKLGKPGNAIADGIRKVRQDSDIWAGKYKAEMIRNGLGKLTDKERTELLNMLEGRAQPQGKLLPLFQVIDRARNDFGSKAQEMKILVRGSDGSIYYFNPRQKYFVHKIPPTRITKTQ